MEIEFDPEKREKTLTERGLDFLDAPLVFAGSPLTAEVIRQEYGEQRWITYGELNGRAVVVVWTQRGISRRIISMRHAHDEELRNAGLG